ncbi:hypothetical protein QF035_006692 [Streptomyces umbrinus]|uniref:Uncharacterized protein n=1 Tax=Streptomyces umbrinus TaxID=67370 RepID=A0ABU0SZX3_9ACTN|nr:hypothetical protein [Streptomyces umbrinus]MDQ1029110.1 hypothetical protein [Streptomyces umbrinus]
MPTFEQALEPVQGEAPKSLATALRSLFHALKRERLIFRDPARAVSLTTAVVLPRPLADDMLRGALGCLPTPATGSASRSPPRTP